MTIDQYLGKLNSRFKTVISAYLDMNKEFKI